MPVTVRSHGGSAEAPAAVTDASIGMTLRRLRHTTGRSLAEVGRACDLSPSFLSLVENDKSDITIGRLTRLVAAYGISITDLLATPAPADAHIIRRGERHHLASPSEGIDVYLLVRATNGRMLPQLLEIKPGASLAEPGQHHGEEWIYVLSGELVLEVDGLPVRVLDADDAASYSSEQRHTFRNPSAVRSARVICVNSPPNL